MLNVHFADGLQATVSPIPKGSRHGVDRVLKALQLDDEVSVQLERDCRIDRIIAGQSLIKTGDEVFRWFLILDGLIGQFQVMHDKASYPIMIHGTNAWIGQDVIYGGGFSHFDYTALTDVKVISIAAHDFRRLALQEEAFASSLLNTLAAQTRRQFDLLSIMKFGNVTVRIVAGLALLTDSLTAGDDTSGCDCHGDDELVLPISQRVIGQLCGVSKSHFSSCMQFLAQEAWIVTHYGSLQICHVQAWKRLAQEVRFLNRMDFDANEQELHAMLQNFQCQVKNNAGESPDMFMNDELHPVATGRIGRFLKRTAPLQPRP